MIALYSGPTTIAATIRTCEFLAVGEIALCVAYLDGWPARQRIWPWATALIGLAVVRRGTSATSRPSLVSQSYLPTG